MATSNAGNLGRNTDAGNSTAKEKLKPPLLEYWKPPKAVVFAPKPVVGSNNATRDAGGFPRKENDRSRNSRLPFDIKTDIKEKESSNNPVCSQDDINSRSNSVSSYNTTSPSPLSSSNSSLNNISRLNTNRFTWADSTTTLVGVKDTDNTSFKSIPWGYDEKSFSPSWGEKRERAKVLEQEVISTPDTLARMGMASNGPPAYRLDDKDTLAPHWWQVQYWSWKKKALIALTGAAALAIIIAVVVEVERSNRYPDYTTLNYTKVDQFTGTQFFDNFDYFGSTTDPTNGFVQYVDQQTAAQLNLTYAGSSAAVVRVDTSDSNAVDGRQSVRITSKNTWDNGLFIFDVLHTPYGCATWPALWLSDVPNWPKHGEIDVMEQVNQGADGNIMTLHTSNDCSMSVKRKEAGTVSATNCYNGTDDNAGCGVTGTASTYGEAFNKKGGGIMAMELRAAGIRIWQFLRDEIPTDITDETPDPSTWGEALADFPNTDCDITSHFKNQTIIVNIEICGDWAGATSIYSGEDQCPGTCKQYAQTNATAFETAYFEFGNFTIYQSN